MNKKGLLAVALLLAETLCAPSCDKKRDPNTVALSALQRLTPQGWIADPTKPCFFHQGAAQAQIESSEWPRASGTFTTVTFTKIEFNPALNLGNKTRLVKVDRSIARDYPKPGYTLYTKQSLGDKMVRFGDDEANPAVRNAIERVIARIGGCAVKVP